MATAEKTGTEMASREEGDTSSDQLDDSAIAKGSLAEVEEMHSQIRKLREKRAAVMMSEVAELRKERDIAVGSNKILSQTFQDLTLELEALKKANNKNSSKVAQLERNIFEEKIYSSDLKRKLQMANKQTAHLKSEIKNMRSRLGESGSLLQVSLDMESSLERSRSMNDIGQEVEKEGTEKEQERQDTSPSQPPPQKSKREVLLVAPKDTPSPLVQSRVATELLIPSKSMPPSSSVTPKRYRLATEKPRNVGVQTVAPPTEENNIKIADLEAVKARHDEDKKALEKTIKTLQLEVKSIKEYKMKLEKRVKEIQVEHDVLKTGMEAFSTWTRQRLQSVEEDIDVCRVVYSLHGSMSQEAQLIKELQEKLSVCVQKQRDAEALNKYLNSNIETFEDQVKQFKRQNELLKEKVLLLTPVKSSKQSFYPAETSSPKPQHLPTTPQTLRSPLTQSSPQRLASTPQTVRSPVAQPSPLILNGAKTTPTIILTPEHSEAGEQLKRRDHDHTGSIGKASKDGGRRTKDRSGLRSKTKRVVKEKLVKNGDNWYSIPDDDDDESVV